jgi:hypothetical protein
MLGNASNAISERNIKIAEELSDNSRRIVVQKPFPEGSSRLSEMLPNFFRIKNF